MKEKKFKKTKAKLPDDEYNIGGDAPKGCENKKRIIEMEKLVKKVQNRLKKSHE